MGEREADLRQAKAVLAPPKAAGKRRAKPVNCHPPADTGRSRP